MTEKYATHWILCAMCIVVVWDWKNVCVCVLTFLIGLNNCAHSSISVICITQQAKIKLAWSKFLFSNMVAAFHSNVEIFSRNLITKISKAQTYIEMIGRSSIKRIFCSFIIIYSAKNVYNSISKSTFVDNWMSCAQPIVQNKYGFLPRKEISSNNVLISKLYTPIN